MPLADGPLGDAPGCRALLLRGGAVGPRRHRNRPPARFAAPPLVCLAGRSEDQLGVRPILAQKATCFQCVLRSTRPSEAISPSPSTSNLIPCYNGFRRVDISVRTTKKHPFSHSRVAIRVAICSLHPWKDPAMPDAWCLSRRKQGFESPGKRQ